MAITYNKDGAYIEVTEDGVVHRRSIKWKDCVVSVPNGSNMKIDSIYVNSSDQLVLVLEDESEITITKYTDIEAQAVADARIATHTEDDDAHHTKYTDGEAMVWAIALGG